MKELTEQDIMDIFGVEPKKKQLPFAEMRKKLGYPPLRSKEERRRGFEWLATDWQKEKLGDKYHEGMTYNEAEKILS